MSPYNDPLAATPNLTGHGQPMIQGKVTYSIGSHGVKAKFWSNFVTEGEQADLGGLRHLGAG